MIEHANHVRPTRDGVKVGGHQASRASMVTLMTTLYLHHLDADDFVAVKPHGRLQGYPSRKPPRRIGDEALRRALRCLPVEDHRSAAHRSEGAARGRRRSASGSPGAADQLHDEGVSVDVVDVTSPGRLCRTWHSEVVRGVHTARVPGLPGALRACSPSRAPIVTVHDASGHALAWLDGSLGVPMASLGVDSFEQSGGVQDLRRDHSMDTGSIVNAALGVMVL